MREYPVHTYGRECVTTQTKRQGREYCRIPNENLHRKTKEDG